jgi:LmbE family N-acetylglucosaminyl deacetylase
VAARRILVVAAHPDDEVLGVGATVARHARAGDEVHALIVAEGSSSRGGSRDAAVKAHEIESLRESARAAARVLGAHPPRFGDGPDNRLDEMALLDVVKIVEHHVADVRPETVYTHHAGDLNVDHRVVHQAVLTACRPLPGSSVREILAYETVSSTEWGTPFVPNHFVAVDGFVDAKLRALECYRSEMREFPHPRSAESIRALAAFRGASIGASAAEAFAVVRSVIR